ncbi:MAG: rRNA pseudouridine synthase [Planctomycetaceae bacterium]|nr:rRNA pseudouridine synthase [Planctomycetaceae bacterium]
MKIKNEQTEPQRLQKILAAAGFGSRRQCEELLLQGRVEVNGNVVPLGTKVHPDTDEIKVDGERLKHSKRVYLALYKPKGYLCTDRDQQGRQRTIDLIPEKFGRLFLIGRLDKDSEGLILATNDGEFSQKLTHPKFGVPKVYRVQVAGEVTYETVKKLKEGVYLSDGFAKAADCVIKGQHKQSTILDLTLTEGMNREVRRLLAKLGHKVQTLFRIAVGPIRLGKLAPGEWRLLSKNEINTVQKSPLSFPVKKCNNRRNNTGNKTSNKTKKQTQRYKNR